MPRSPGRSASCPASGLERAHGKPELTQAILDETLRALLRAEDAGDPHEALQEVDRVREANLDCAPQGCVRFHEGMRNRLLSSARTGRSLVENRHGANHKAVSQGASGLLQLNACAKRETLPLSWPSIENTEEA